jgi:Family of unknown function (DUF6535)
MFSSSISVSESRSNHHCDVSVGKAESPPVGLIVVDHGGSSGPSPIANNQDNSVPDDELLVAGQPPSIWSTYVKAAEEYDAKLVERWKSDMDVLLVFVSTFDQDRYNTRFNTTAGRVVHRYSYNTRHQCLRRSYRKLCSDICSTTSSFDFPECKWNSWFITHSSPFSRARPKCPFYQRDMVSKHYMQCQREHWCYAMQIMVYEVPEHIRARRLPRTILKHGPQKTEEV